MTTWEPDKWNKDIYIRKSHNCYTYAMNIIGGEYSKYIQKVCKQKNGICPRPQPGQKSGMPDITGSPFTLKQLITYIQLDYPSFKKHYKHKKVPKGYHLIVLCLLPNKTDYHFYRRDISGIWSHKNGWRMTKNRDDKGKYILDPKDHCKHTKYSIYSGLYIVKTLTY